MYASTTYWTSVAALDGSTAVVCYTHSSSRGVCRVLTASWGSVNGWELTGGTEVFFHTGYVQRISVAALDASTALVCYKDSGSTSDKHGTCNVLSVSGATLSVGASGTFTSGSTDFISVTRLSLDDAIVCYNTNAPHDTVSLSTYGACNLLNVAGATFTVGANLGFSVNTGVTSVAALGAFPAGGFWKGGGGAAWCVMPGGAARCGLWHVQLTQSSCPWQIRTVASCAMRTGLRERAQRATTWRGRLRSHGRPRRRPRRRRRRRFQR